MGSILETAVKIQNKYKTDLGIRNITPEKALKIPEMKIRCFTIGHKHNDKTPALSIKDKASIFKCFACGIIGRNSFDMVLHYVWHLYIKVNNIQEELKDNKIEWLMTKYNINNDEYSKMEDLIEKYTLNKTLKNLMNLSNEKKIDFEELRSNENINLAAQDLYKEMYGQNFDISKIFSQKFDMREDIEKKQEIIKEFYNFVKKDCNGEPSKELIEYFKTRNINEKTLKDRGILYLSDDVLIKLRKFMIQKFSIKTKEISENDFVETGMNHKYIKSKLNEEQLKTIYSKWMKNKKEFDGDKFYSSVFEIILGIDYLRKNDFLNENQDMSFKNNKVIMPFMRQPKYGEKGRQVEGLQFRSIDPNCAKSFRFMGYGPLTIYNKDLLENSDTIIIFEGGSDANTAVQLGYPAISIPGAGSKLSKQEISLFMGKKVYIMGDNDEPGIAFIENISKILGPIIINPDKNNKVTQIKLPNDKVNDFNEWHSTYNTDNKIDPINKYIDKSHHISEVKERKIPEIKNRNLNVSLGINTTMEKNRIGKTEDIEAFIIENDLKVFSIADRNFMKMKEYIKIANKKNIKFIPSLKVSLGGLHDITIMFHSREEITEVQDKIYNNIITLKDLNNLSQTITIVLPMSLNKLLLNKKFINRQNVMIGVEPDMSLDYLPSRWAYKPVFFNNNFYIKEKDYPKYVLYKSIMNNTKLDYKNIISPKPGMESTKYIYTTSMSKQKLQYLKPKNRIKQETMLKQNYLKIIDNTIQISENFFVSENIMLDEKPDLHNIILKDETKKIVEESPSMEDSYTKKEFKDILLYMWNEKIIENEKFSGLSESLKYIKSKNIVKQIAKEDIPKYKKRIEQELDVLNSFGDSNFFKYFIILKDCVDFLNSKGFDVGIGRGSATSSLIGYMLGIHQVDPIKYNLFFERFLNKGRMDYPDVDLDISQEGRIVLLDYLVKKYDGNVAYIKVINSIGVKGSISDSLRIMGFDSNIISKISNGIDKINLDDKRDNVKSGRIPNELLTIYTDNPGMKELVSSQVGEVNNYIVHVSAVIIDKENFNFDIEDKDGFKMLNTDKHNIHKIKFDLLNSKNVSRLETAKKYLPEDISKLISTEYLNYDDENVWKTLRTIDFIGIPQLDNEVKSKREYKEKFLRELVPENISDLSDFLALIRPGALESKKEYLLNKRIEYTFTNKNPRFILLNNKYPEVFNGSMSLKEIKNKYSSVKSIMDYVGYKTKYDAKDELSKELDNSEEYRKITNSTYGSIIYQEQIMEILNKMAGYPLEDTNEIRSAISNKDKVKLMKYKEEIILRIKQNSTLTEEAVNHLYHKIEKSSEYAFNKAHSVGYAMTSYNFLYLKTNHYPVFYMSTKEHYPKSLLTIDKKYEKRAMINISKDSYYVKNNKIIAPLRSLKILKENRSAMLEILENQPFKNYSDMMNKVSKQIINKSIIEKLRKENFFPSNFFESENLSSNEEKIIKM